MSANATRQRPPAFALTRLTLAGADAASFLQGYLTCDLDALDEGAAMPMAHCNIKGRVLANGWAAGNPKRVDLFIHESVADALAEHLSRYLAFAKAELMQHPEPLTAGAAGDIELPPLGAFLRPAATAAPDAADELERRCIDASFGLVSAPVSERFLPQMLGLVEIGAVSFSKGCYLGQEVVARAQHRGEVKRRLAKFQFTGARPVAGDATEPSGTVIHARAANEGASCGMALAVTGTSAAVLRGEAFELTPA